MSTQPAPLPRTPIAAPDGERFPWGPIQSVHTLGQYEIVEYLSDKSNSRQPEYWHEHGTTLFHPYINGRDIHRSFYTLESAIVGAIAYQRRGPNSQAAEHFDLITLGEVPPA